MNTHIQSAETDTFN